MQELLTELEQKRADYEAALARCYAAGPQLISAVRTRKGWSQQELGDRLGFGRSYISKVEAGAKTPSLRLVQALLDVS